MDFEVNGRYSIDRDVPSGISGLIFKWSCEQSETTSDNFCNKPMENSK